MQEAALLHLNYHTLFTEEAWTLPARCFGQLGTDQALVRGWEKICCRSNLLSINQLQNQLHFSKSRMIWLSQWNWSSAFIITKFLQFQVPREFSLCIFAGGKRTRARICRTVCLVVTAPASIAILLMCAQALLQRSLLQCWGLLIRQAVSLTLPSLFFSFLTQGFVFPLSEQIQNTEIKWGKYRGWSLTVEVRPQKTSWEPPNAAFLAAFSAMHTAWASCMDAPRHDEAHTCWEAAALSPHSIYPGAKVNFFQVGRPQGACSVTWQRGSGLTQ